MQKPRGARGMVTGQIDTCITDTDDNSNLVSDVDQDTSIRIVRSELKNGTAPGIDNVHNDILKKATGTGFYMLLPRGFAIN